MPDFDDLDFAPTLIGLRSGARVFGGRYTLEREIGRGGAGVVWLANDTSLDMPVALKFLPPEVACDDLALADLKKETKRCLVLTHPHIVRVYGWHEENGLAAIAMEYIDGASLSKLRLQRENWVFTPEEVRPWLKSACEALEYAHGKARVVHRDVKPGNLMVDRHGELKVCDFGIARSLGESRSRLTGGRVGESAGTPPYMSPQHRMGMGPSPADDVYGLGATLYQLLTGKPPFYTGDISYQIENVVPPPMAKRREELGVTGAAPIPAEWETLVASCLEKNPARRPASAVEVWQRLDGPVPERRVERRAEPKREVEKPVAAKPARSPILVAGLIAGAVVAVAALGMGVMSHVAAMKKNQPGDRPPQSEVAAVKEREKAAVIQTDLEAARREKEEAERKARATEAARVEAEKKAEADRAAAKAAKEERVKAVEAARWEREEADRKAREVASALEEAQKMAELERAAAKVAEEERLKAAEAARLASPPKAGDRMVVEIAPGMQMAFRWCPPGTFTMGSPESEKARDNDETQHQVTLSKGFWLAETEVTQGQWKTIMKSNPSRFKGSDQLPVEWVSWDEAKEFLKKAQAPAGMALRLPTEAEWEYACRAGTTGPYAGELAEMAWYIDNAGDKTHPVGTKQANAWGLRDMHGNVLEWTRDWYGSYPAGELIDPGGPPSGVHRVPRGGLFSANATGCRAAYRFSFGPALRSRFYMGFRPALVPSQ